MHQPIKQELKIWRFFLGASAITRKTMKSTNNQCRNCVRSYNQLNGCYCMKLARIVEHCATPPCKLKFYKPQMK